jgi:hypothetical protein
VGGLLDERWDDPKHGLTAADFARWPGRGGLKREKLIPVVQGALDAGTLETPVYLLGECTTYDTPHGHPVHGMAIHVGKTFAVWGQPFDRWPRITILDGGNKGFGKNKRHVDGSTVLPQFDHVELEQVPSPHGGYVDVQMFQHGIPTARIGFIWSHGDHDLAHDRAQLLAKASLLCREGRWPDGSPSS